MGRWQFEQLRGGPKRNPQEAELFKNIDADEGEYAGNDYLVREVIQNSLDARAPGEKEPVQVRFAIHDASEAPSAERMAHYFGRLREPLQSFDIPSDTHGVPLVNQRFLVCEDFGTCGLEGDPGLYKDPDRNTQAREDFYWFWRNIGRSAKTNEDLGRWGLGKTVYRAVSQVRCMLGLTIRRSDGRRLLMGQTVLQPHQHGPHEYHPEGYWCDEGNHDFSEPIENLVELNQFREEWCLHRSVEPGLSIVSPFVPDELCEKRILRAVAVNFFVRILKGELEVEVFGSTIGSVKVDAQSIDGICRGLEWSHSEKRRKLHAPPPLDFIRSCLALTPPTTTNLIGDGCSPCFSEHALEKQVHQNLQQEFADGKLVALRVQMDLPRRDNSRQVGEFNVYVQRDLDGQPQDSYYVREGMTITKRSSHASQRGVRAFVNIESGPMARLLGDTEGPAHEEWDKQAERPNREWWKWKTRVEFVRRIVDNLVEYLTPSQEDQDFDLLADFFSVERTSGRQRNRQQGEEDPDEPTRVFPNPRPKWFQITPRADGFSILRNKAVDVPEGAELEVSIAYDLPSGNPYAKWSPLDFDIGEPEQINVSGVGVEPKKISGNVVKLKISAPEFRFSMSGFDQYRDLLVDARENTNGSSNVEADL